MCCCGNVMKRIEKNKMKRLETNSGIRLSAPGFWISLSLRIMPADSVAAAVRIFFVAD